MCTPSCWHGLPSPACHTPLPTPAPLVASSLPTVISNHTIRRHSSSHNSPSGSHEHVTLRLSCPKYYLICPTSRLFFVPQLECSFSFDFPRRTLPGPLLCNGLSFSSLSTLLPPPPPPVQFHRVSCRYSRPGPSLHACRAARPAYSACPELPPQPASCAARSSQDREEFWGLLVCHCFYDG